MLDNFFLQIFEHISRTNVLFFILALYIIPFFSLFNLRISKNFLTINYLLGQFDRVFAPMRLLVNLLLLGYFSLLLIHTIDLTNVLISLACIFIIILDILHRLRKRGRLINLAKAISQNKLPDPSFFYRMIDSAHGPFSNIYTGNIPYIKIKDIDFRNRRKLSKWHIILKGIIVTIKTTKLTKLAANNMEAKSLSNACLHIAGCWGLQILKLCRAKIHFRNIEFIEASNEPIVYLFTHESFLDFAVAPLVAEYREQIGLSSKMPSFIVAADHFLRNPIYRWVLGLGSAAKALNMIFVRRKGKPDDAKYAEQEMIKAIINKNDLAIFPQGTRAYGRINKLKQRMQAGYYAVSSKKRLQEDNAHIKKGVAYLGFNLADTKIQADFLPIAIKGTSKICPKGSLEIQSNVVVEFVAGQPIKTTQMKGKSTEDWVAKIDLALQNASGINSYLDRCFLEDMRRVLPPYELEELSLSLKPWRAKDHMIYSVLDVIYSTPLNNRLGFLRQLSNLLLSDEKREKFLELKKTAVNEIKL